MKRVGLLVLVGMMLAGCASFAGIQTYVVSADQLEAARTALGIPACPDGQPALIVGSKLETGGGTISVRCGGIPVPK